VKNEDFLKKWAFRRKNLEKITYRWWRAKQNDD